MRWIYISRGHSRANFFAAFRIVVWQFLYYSRELGDLAPQYAECGAFCADREKPLDGFCADCPKKELKEDFRFNCIEFLNERAPGWEKYGFDEIFRQVLDVFDYEKLPFESLTTTSAAMIEILEAEREKMRRVDEWNNKQRRNAAN